MGSQQFWRTQLRGTVSPVASPRAGEGGVRTSDVGDAVVATRALPTRLPANRCRFCNPGVGRSAWPGDHRLRVRYRLAGALSIRLSRSHSSHRCGHVAAGLPVGRIPKPCPPEACMWSSAGTPTCFSARYIATLLVVFA